MRVALAAAAVAVATVAVPAQAIGIYVEPSLGTEVLTSSEYMVCTNYNGPNGMCVTTHPGFAPALPEIYLDVASLSGSYSFNQTFGVNASGGATTITGVVNFSTSGSLLNSTYNFNYMQAYFNGTNGESQSATGYVINAAVRVLDTGAILTPVPEPTTWVTITCGFGAIGATMRRRRVRRAVSLA